MAKNIERMNLGHEKSGVKLREILGKESREILEKQKEKQKEKQRRKQRAEKGKSLSSYKIAEKKLKEKGYYEREAEEKKEEEIIYGEWFLPAGTGELVYPDKKGRPVVRFLSENIKGEIPEKYKKPKPIYVLFPLYTKGAVEKAISKGEKEILISFLRKIRDKKGNEILITQSNILEEERKKGIITREIIEDQIKRYLKSIKEGIKEGKISKEEERKIISAGKTKREILSFMFPGGILSLKEIEEELRTKFGIKNAILKNKSIISLITKEKKPEDLTKEDLIFFESEKEKYKSGKEKYEAILEKYREEVIKATALLSGQPKEEIKQLFEEDPQKLRELIRDTWGKQVVIPGIVRYNLETGEIELTKKTSLDSKICLFLLRMFGIKIQEIKYTDRMPIPGALNLNIGNIIGIGSDKERRVVYIDCHGPNSKKTTPCTSKFLWLALESVGFFKDFDEKNKMALKKMLNFVSWVIRRTPPLPKEISKEEKKEKREEKKKKYLESLFEKSGDTMWGLAARFISPKKLYKFFEGKEKSPEKESPFDILTLEELEEYGLKKGSDIQKKIINESKEILGNLEKEGYIINTNYGEVVIDICGNVGGGYDAALGYGLKGIIIYCPEWPRRSFFISIDGAKDLREVGEKLKQGFCVQENILIKPMTINENLRTSNVLLKKIIEALGGKVPEKGKLRKYCDDQITYREKQRKKRFFEDTQKRKRYYNKKRTEGYYKKPKPWRTN